MDEYWVCQHCRSLNRAASAKCYSCGKKYGSKPPEAGATGKASAPSAPPPSPYQPAPRPAPQVTQSPYQASGTESVPSYLARPAAPPSVPKPYLTESQPEGRLPNPKRSIERRISAALAVRPSVSVSAPGWLAILSLGAVLAIGALLAVTGLSGAMYALQHADVPGGWNQLTSSQRGLVEILLVAEAATCLIALISFSVFVALSTHNTTGLGADATALLPGSGLRMWPSLVWFHVRTALAFVAPVVLIYYGYELVGLILAVLVVEVAQRHSDDALDWFQRPAQHLPELHRKLGTEGATDSPVADVWSAAFRVANISAVALYLMPAIGLTVAVAMRTSGKELKLWQDSGLGLGQLAFLAVAVVVAISAALTLLATMVMTLAIMRRQRTRRTLVRVGRSRSWTAKPGEGMYGAAANGPGANGVAATAVSSAGYAGYAGATGANGAAGLANAGGYGARYGVSGAAAANDAWAGYDPTAGYDATAELAGLDPASGSGGTGFGSSGFTGSLLDDERFAGRQRLGGAADWSGARPSAPEPSAPQWPGAQPPAPPSSTDRWPGAQPPASPSASPSPWGSRPPAPEPAASRWPAAQPPIIQPSAWPGPRTGPEPAQPSGEPGASGESDESGESGQSGEGRKPGSLMRRVQSGLAAHAREAAAHAEDASQSAQAAPQTQENGAPSSGAPSSSDRNVGESGATAASDASDQASLNSPSTTSSSAWESWPDDDSSD